LSFKSLSQIVVFESAFLAGKCCGLRFETKGLLFEYSLVIYLTKAIGAPTVAGISLLDARHLSRIHALSRMRFC